MQYNILYKYNKLNIPGNSQFILVFYYIINMKIYLICIKMYYVYFLYHIITYEWIIVISSYILIFQYTSSKYIHRCYKICKCK